MSGSERRREARSATSGRSRVPSSDQPDTGSSAAFTDLRALMFSIGYRMPPSTHFGDRSTFDG